MDLKSISVIDSIIFVMVKTNMNIMGFSFDNFSKFFPIYFKNQIIFFTLGDLLFIFLMSYSLIARNHEKMKHLLVISKDTILMGKAINQKYGK
ncbi:hypothetical protein M058_06190 [Streptococcus mitis 17/34]|nr:hypothetical protein M058_06190 [Streptococcus mitis 17/34]